MTRKDFIFLQGFPVGRQKKEQEIEQARARSHAAKVVHRRTKEIAHQFQQDLVAVDGKHTVHANNWLLRHFWIGTYPTVYAGFHGMRVDPFSRVPSSYDRDIAQVIDFGMPYPSVSMANLLTRRKCSGANFRPKQQHRR